MKKNIDLGFVIRAILELSPNICYSRMAEKLGCSVHAISYQAAKMGLPKRRRD